ncbi:MAG: type II toxin-antitoxin system Phd/YefM family antitoxin [Tepidisphaeraceae bacterium]
MPVKLKQDLTTAAERVQQNGKRIPVRRNGRIVAALVPAEDYKMLEEMDRRDVALARRALARAKARGERSIPWEEVRKQIKR